MPLNWNAFREEKDGGCIDVIKESQRKRFASVELVDEVAALVVARRDAAYKRDTMNKRVNDLSKQIGGIMKQKKKGPLTPEQETEVAQLREEQIKAKASKVELEGTVTGLEKQIHAKCHLVGNYVHESVPVSNDEEENGVVATYGKPRTRKDDEKLYHHHELLHMIDGYSPQSGVVVAGHRGYFLRGVGVLLNQALINYGISFLMKKEYTPLQPPYLMNKDVMAETAQLEQFDEELYKVVSNDNPDDDKYLIATSEQPISAYYRKQWMDERELPIKFAGVSTCFRKEAGAHGKDAWGIFRVHQFEKIEQFCITTPETSWEMHEKMTKVAEEFYQSLGLAYRVVAIVSGALNNAAAKKLDLEAWFPTLGEWRELVSCSNCTDYQSRAMETRCGSKKTGEREKRYVHMLNGTLCATERTICGILETHQTPEGVTVPEVLRPFMGGIEFMPFKKAPPANTNRTKTAKGKAKKQGQK